MKPDLHQGRIPDQLRRLYAANAWLLDALYMLAICMAGAVLILALGGCASRQYPVVVHYGDISRCNVGAVSCTVGDQVYCVQSDPIACDHEVYDHRLGHLVHSEPPINNCVRVIDPGKTKWHAGKWLCRDTVGYFYEVKA